MPATQLQGGCIVPVEGQACSPGEVACDDGQNACCRGYVWNCDGHWRKLGLGCACQVAQPFACGDKTCTAGPYCQDTNIPNHTGDGGSTQSCQCLDVPTACSATPTCQCLSQHVGCGCTETNGHLQTLCLAP